MLVTSRYLWLVLLGHGASLVSPADWFAIIFTGRLPERLGGYLIAVLRYQWRMTAFLCGLTTRYPRFPANVGACLASPCHRSGSRREIKLSAQEPAAACRPAVGGRAIGPGLASDATPAGVGGGMTPAGVGAGATPAR